MSERTGIPGESQPGWDEQCESCLQALYLGEVGAALVLADYLQDISHPRWERVSEIARALQETESFLFLASCVLWIHAIVTGTEQQANAAYVQFKGVKS